MRKLTPWMLCLLGLVGCQKEWTQRELKPVVVKLNQGFTVTISLPDGVKRSNEDDAVVAMMDPTPLDGPSVILTRTRRPVFDTADAYIAASRDSNLEKRDVPDGYGVVYDSNGPGVHVTRKRGSEFIECDGSFSGDPKDKKARAEMIWKICSSIQ